MKNKLSLLLFYLALTFFPTIFALRIPIYLVSGKYIGSVKAHDTIYGVLFTPALSALPAGTHGLHIHMMPFCSDKAMAAGGHLDPLRTNKHHGPYKGDGHLGDLPVLIVDAFGKATLPVLAPRLKLAQIKGHTLMIHAGSDNYADIPEKLGGGGARIACGVIPYH